MTRVRRGLSVPEGVVESPYTTLLCKGVFNAWEADSCWCNLATVKADAAFDITAGKGGNQHCGIWGNSDAHKVISLAYDAVYLEYAGAGLQDTRLPSRVLNREGSSHRLQPACLLRATVLGWTFILSKISWPKS